MYLGYGNRLDETGLIACIRGKANCQTLGDGGGIGIIAHAKTTGIGSSYAPSAGIENTSNKNNT